MRRYAIYRRRVPVLLQLNFQIEIVSFLNEKKKIMKIWAELFCSSSRYPACCSLCAMRRKGPQSSVTVAFSNSGRSKFSHPRRTRSNSTLDMLMSKLEWSSSTCHSSRLLIEWISSIRTRTVYYALYAPAPIVPRVLQRYMSTQLQMHILYDTPYDYAWEMYWRAYIDQMTKLKWSDRMRERKQSSSGPVLRCCCWNSNVGASHCAMYTNEGKTWTGGGCRMAMHRYCFSTRCQRSQEKQQLIIQPVRDNISKRAIHQKHATTAAAVQQKQKQKPKAI